MFFKLSTLLITGLSVGLAISTPVTSLQDSETNAQRFARGLPPNPPKYLTAIGAGSGPTPASSSRRSLTSPLPPVSLSGRLEIRSKENGGGLGNVRNWPGGGTISGTNFLGPDGDLLVTLTYSPSNPHEIDILATNPAFPAPFYVGAGSFSTATIPTLGVNSRSTVGFTNVEQTAQDSTPVKAPTRDAYVESAIWSVDSSTKQLTAQWINSDGSKPPTILAYDIRNNRLFFTGDISAFNENNNFPASAVDLFLV